MRRRLLTPLARPCQAGAALSNASSRLSPWLRVRYGLEYAGFRLLAGLLSAMPLERASALSGFLWRAVAPRLERHRRAMANLKFAFPEKSEAERREIALAMWDNLGRSFAEFFHLKQIHDEGRLAYEDREAVMAIVAGGPFVVCAPHMGNWETLAFPGLDFAVPFTGVYQQLTNPFVEAWLLKARAPLYPGGLAAKSLRTGHTLLKRARAGGVVAFLADQREVRGQSVPFFGREAMSNAFPAFIARSQKIPFCAARVKRLPGVRYSLRLERVEFPVTDDPDADIRAATAALQARFEAFIREAPEQWMWGQKRWG